ncbi:CHASE2 domain-containing protein [Baaleninema sp.]|uniref:CHASE2 domain-containing protein n=1 Tax=Baaleninema sp. TaxID=3101197 RepID=UPI003D01D4EC
MVRFSTRPLVTLDLGTGSLATGFPDVTLRLTTDETTIALKRVGSLPPAPELQGLYQRWQLLYIALYRGFVRRGSLEGGSGWNWRIDIAEDDVTQVSEIDFKRLCREYRSQFEAWLQSPEFSLLEGQLRSHLSPDTAFDLAIETDDSQTRRLPWHFWQFVADYPHTELARSGRTYRQVSTDSRRDRIAGGNRRVRAHCRDAPTRILAVFGSSHNLDLSIDRQQLQQLPHTEITWCVEPSRQEFHDRLWEEKGWDIVFFAGHSRSASDFPEDFEDSGAIALNSQEHLSPEDATFALQTAIEKGLQLVVLNSCDGLGIGACLVDFGLPAAVVMGEPVADAVAQQFLAAFLNAYSRQGDLSLAVREARERLQAIEDRFPCASWLPVLFRNPAASVFPAIPTAPPVAPPPPLLQFSWLWRNRKPLYLSVSIALGVLLLRSLGLLESLELKGYDWMLRQRPPEAPDDRLLLVNLTEEDITRLGRWPASDATLAQLLAALQRHRPRVIGLNLYRNLAVAPGTEALAVQFQQSNLVGICKGRDRDDGGVDAPPGIPPERLGFNDVVLDRDRLLRRHVLSMTRHPPQCDTPHSLSMQLAYRYLEPDGIAPKLLPQEWIQLGEVVLKPLEPSTVVYWDFSGRMFQLMLNYRNAPRVAREVTWMEVLDNRVNPEWIRDRAILIGVDATSTPDNRHLTPYGEMTGTQIHAHGTSQILSAVLDDRAIIEVRSPWEDGLWVLAWSIVGGAMGWGFRRRVSVAMGLGVGAIGLSGCCYGLLVWGVWLPWVPAWLGLLVSGWGATRLRGWK